MLKIHILNVGHGDSILLEHYLNDEKSFAVIDSNRQSGEPPRALKKLQSLGVQRLNFVALTHPHADHFKGLLDILKQYRGKLDSFYSFPVGLHKEGQLKKYAKIFHDVLKNMDNENLRKPLAEYIKLLHELKTQIKFSNWGELSGPENTVMTSGFSDVDIQAILPYLNSKGPYFQQIEKGEVDAIAHQNLNELSLAFKIKYKGIEIILGGDGTYKNWIKHRTENSKRNRKLEAVAVKIQHHGSEEDCKIETLEYLFGNDGERYACISANGKTHPAKSVLNNISDLGIFPYCTNLSVSCGARAGNSFVVDDSIDPKLMLFINKVTEVIPGSSPEPCQGDIEILISDEGFLSVNTEHNMACPYRGDFDFLSTSV